MNDDHIDVWDFIDKTGEYMDYYDTVQKRADGSVFIRRWHSCYLPGKPPYLLAQIGGEDIPLDALMPEALTQVQRLAEGLEGGDKSLYNKSFCRFYWVEEDGPVSNLTNAQVTLKSDYDFPQRVVKQYDLVCKRPSGEVFVQRESKVYINESVVYIQSLPAIEISLEALSPESLAKVLQIAERIGNLGSPDRSFFWNENASDMYKDPANRLVILKE